MHRSPSPISLNRQNVTVAVAQLGTQGGKATEWATISTYKTNVIVMVCDGNGTRIYHAQHLVLLTKFIALKRSSGTRC